MNPDPTIIAFLCNWCAYEGADAAGRARAVYPPGLRVVRLMCSGRIAPHLVFEAFARGADGVMILGCQLGDCHYRNGNYQALGKYELLKRILPRFGIHRERLCLEWVSAREQKKFVETVSAMVETIRKLGPLYGGGGPRPEFRLQESLSSRPINP